MRFCRFVLFVSGFFLAVKMVLTCRYYNEKYPEIDDVVMVNVRSIGEMGAYVHLLEYNNIEGMILLSELSRRRIRSINKLIRVGKTEPVVVIRVDKEKGKLAGIVFIGIFMRPILAFDDLLLGTKQRPLTVF